MKLKYRILLASETYPPDVNGAAIFVERLARMLAENGHEVMVIAPNTTLEDRWENVQRNFKILRIKTVSL